MRKSLVSDPRYCLLSSDYDCMGMYFSGLVRSKIFVHCFGLELCLMCHLINWSSCLDQQPSLSGHKMNMKILVCRQQKSSNWRIRLIQLNHTMLSRSLVKQFVISFYVLLIIASTFKSKTSIFSSQSKRKAFYLWMYLVQIHHMAPIPYSSLF